MDWIIMYNNPSTWDMHKLPKQWTKFQVQGVRCNKLNLQIPQNAEVNFARWIPEISGICQEK